jgi:hypothetical protein
MAETNEAYKGDAYCVKCKAKRDFEGMVHISDSGRRIQILTKVQLLCTE